MKNFNKLMNYSKTSTTLMIAFVVLVSVFMFLIYRKRMREGVGRWGAARFGSNRFSRSRSRGPPPSYMPPPGFGSRVDLSNPRFGSGYSIQSGFGDDLQKFRNRQEVFNSYPNQSPYSPERPQPNRLDMSNYNATYGGTRNDIRPREGVLVYGRTPGPHNYTFGGQDGNIGNYPLRQYPSSPSSYIGYN